MIFFSKHVFYFLFSISLIGQVNLLYCMDPLRLSAKKQPGQAVQCPNSSHPRALTPQAIQEIRIFRKELILKEFYGPRLLEINREIEAISEELYVVQLGDMKTPNPSPQREKVLQIRLDQLTQEKASIRTQIEQELMAMLTPEQQAAVREYVTRRDVFFKLKKDAVKMGGTPFYELDPTTYIPYAQPHDRSDVCSYLMELRLSNPTPNWRLEDYLYDYEMPMVAEIVISKIEEPTQSAVKFEAITPEPTIITPKVITPPDLSFTLIGGPITVQALSYSTLIELIKRNHGGFKSVRKYLNQLEVLAKQRNCDAQLFLGVFYSCSHVFKKDLIHADIAKSIHLLEAYIANNSVSIKTPEYAHACFVLGKLFANNSHNEKLIDEKAYGLISQAIEYSYQMLPDEISMFISLCYRTGRDEQVQELIKKTGNQSLFTWYSGLYILRSQAHVTPTHIEKAIALFEPLFPLIPGRTYLNLHDLIGLEDVIKILHQNINQNIVQAFLIRLGLVFGFEQIKLNISNVNKEQFIITFIKKTASSQNASIQALIGYLYNQQVVVVENNSMQAVFHLVRALENTSLQSSVRDEVIYLLEQRGQKLFDINFQPSAHAKNSYPKNDSPTRDALSACYALVPVLLNIDPLRAACMFIAAENTIAFLCEKQPTHELVNLPAAVKALQSLQLSVKKSTNLDVLAALIFSCSRRYVSGACLDEQSIGLTAFNKLFLNNAAQYFQANDYTNKKRTLLVSLACNAYCIFGVKLGISIEPLKKLMSGVARAYSDKYWFFRYNLECLLAGSSHDLELVLSSFKSKLDIIHNDPLINAMILKDFKVVASSWCSIS